MKKSVVVLIAVIYVTSVALVSFFGLKAKMYIDKVYVESIEILDPDGRIKIDEEGNPYVTIVPDENGERKYQIQYRVYPDNASSKEVSFNYDKQNTNVTIDENGVVTFKKKGSVIVYIKATDGSGVDAQLEITALR